MTRYIIYHGVLDQTHCIMYDNDSNEIKNNKFKFFVIFFCQPHENDKNLVATAVIFLYVILLLCYVGSQSIILEDDNDKVL
jgi:hypothetical protein